MIIIPKDFMNPNIEINREVEIQPADNAKRLENHILAESFKMGDLDIDKIKQYSKELDSMK